MNKDYFHKYSFNEVLKVEFSTRKQRNQNYSLRAFARDIDLSPSTVSRVFNNKYDLSTKLIEEVLSKIGLPADEVRRIVFFESCFSFLKVLNKDQEFGCSEDLNLTNCCYTKNFKLDKEIFKETACLLYLINDGLFRAISDFSVIDSVGVVFEGSMRSQNQ